MKFRLIFSFLLLSCAVVAVAQDLLACIDPDVRQALVFQGVGSDMVVSRELPSSFNDFKSPGNFSYVGSSVSSFQTVVAYKTPLGVDAALDAAVEILVDSGWQKYPNSMQQTGGFQNSSLPTYSTLCRNDQILSVVARQSEDSTYLNMSVPSDQFSSSCAPMASPLGLAGTDRGLSQHLPTLSLPDGANNPKKNFALLSMGGSSSDSRTARTSIAISTQLTPQDLVDDFGRQLDEQDWQMDTRWLGRSSAGSVWSARQIDSFSLLGTLDVIRTADSTYQAYFRITRVD